MPQRPAISCPEMPPGPRRSRNALLLGGILGCFGGHLSALAEPEETFRSPGDMTIEERTSMMQLVSDYNNCVYHEGIAKVDQFPDIRQAADAAMEACLGTSNKLRAMIEGYRFEPGFSEHFVQHAQSRAARTLIPELAIRKGGH